MAYIGAINENIASREFLRLFACPECETGAYLDYYGQAGKRFPFKIPFIDPKSPICHNCGHVWNFVDLPFRVERTEEEIMRGGK